MTEPIRVYIERVKAALNVTTDEALAAKFGYSKQAVAAWRKRDKVPVEVELKIIDAFGPAMAFREHLRYLAVSREDETVNAASLFFFEHVQKRFFASPDLKQRIAMGYLFPRVQDAVRSAVRDIGFETENSRTVLEILIARIERDDLPELNAICDKLKS